MLWIVGTSVSIESGGYATTLMLRMADELGIACTNLSIGDQTSLMGCMRVLDICQQISPGDVVVWEYSLLDSLLVPDAFPLADVEQARRVAWDAVLKRNAWLLVLMTPPKKSLAKLSDIEVRLVNEATALDIPCIDGRELFRKLGIVDPAAHYRDDRHPRIDSPIIDAMVDAIYTHVASWHGRPGLQRQTTAIHDARPWRWVGAAELAAASGQAAQEYVNALVTVKAACLPVEASIGIPDLGQIVAVGIVSTHESGAIWCGHSECSPVSARLPTNLDYAFLLRTTALPCSHASGGTLSTASRGAFKQGVWAAYGQEPCMGPGPVAVFGILYESGEASTVPRAAYLRWMPRAPVARGWQRVLRGITRSIQKVRRVF